jgi:hypothetical protein
VLKFSYFFLLPQHVKMYERDDPEIARLHSIAKEYFIPPMNNAN